MSVLNANLEQSPPGDIFLPKDHMTSVLEMLGQIVRYCIATEAIIEQGVFIKLVQAKGGRHTTVGAAHIGPDTVIDELAYVEDGSEIGAETKLGYGSTVQRYAQLGRGVTLGIGATIEGNAEIAPGTSIGNFSRVGLGANIRLKVEVGGQAYIAPGLDVQCVTLHEGASIRPRLDF